MLWFWQIFWTNLEIIEISRTWIILTQTRPPRLARMAGVGRQDAKKYLDNIAPWPLCVRLLFRTWIMLIRIRQTMAE